MKPDGSNKEIFSKLQKRKLIPALFFVCGVIVYLQFYSQKASHERLTSYGIKAAITVRKIKNEGVNGVKFSFTTAKGQVIEQTTKCSGDCEKYDTATVIYNPDDPSEYELSFDFESYSLTGRIFFFFFIYLPIMTLFAYHFIKAGSLFFRFFKR